MRALQAMKSEWPPIAGLLALAVLSTLGEGVLTSAKLPGTRAIAFVVLVVLIMGCAFRAIAHAGELGHRLGEPQGSLLLTLSILAIEVPLIVLVMVTGKADPTMARDTIFAGLMLTMNGVVGVVLLAGGLRHRLQEFNLEGARAYLAALIPLAVIGLVLPNFTKAGTGMLDDSQSFAVGAATVLFYLIFLGIQTTRHREFFADIEHGASGAPADAGHATAPMRSHWHFLLLIATLAIIIALGRELARIVDYGINRMGLPTALGGILIATLTLLPESVSAFRAALSDKLQHSVNVFLGGALSTIGLTIPAVLIFGMASGYRVVLGLRGTDLVLLLLTLFVSTLTFGGVRTNVLQGAVHLLIFLIYLVFIFSP
ncbi:MAG: ionic transporter y4hA [Burkholderiaceae bacterium]